MANLEETGIPMSYSEALYAFKAKQVYTQHHKNTAQVPAECVGAAPCPPSITSYT